ncbi:MAG: TolC family protein [Flavobacteriaceae bacterium]
MNKTTITYLLVILAVITFTNTARAQERLSKQEAINKVLENNFNIKVASNEVRIAENNAAFLNSGYLPSLTGIGGADYSIQDQEATFQDGSVEDITGAETTRYNASINLDYTLFDGLGRHYNYKTLKEQYNLSELQARETIETTILQLFSVYFEVARLTENVSVLEETLENTKERLTRAEYQFEYGQNTRLEVLNAQVDITTDSVNLMNTRQQLFNTKRDLTVVLNENLEQLYEVDTVVNFTNELRLEEFLNEAEENNIRLLQAEQNIKITDYQYKAGKGLLLPSLGLSGSYGWNEGLFPSTNFLSSSTSTGFSAGVTLTWDLFDGGSAITSIKNARIQLSNQQFFQEQIRAEVRRDIANAKGNYENRLAIYRMQQDNVAVAESNFERSNERYKLGQISSLELRQAQLNQLNAQTAKNLSKYEAKLAELELLQLTGQLLTVEF